MKLVHFKMAACQNPTVPHRGYHMIFGMTHPDVVPGRKIRSDILLVGNDLKRKYETLKTGCINAAHNLMTSLLFVDTSNTHCWYEMTLASLKAFFGESTLREGSLNCCWFFLRAIGRLKPIMLTSKNHHFIATKNAKCLVSRSMISHFTTGVRQVVAIVGMHSATTTIAG